MEDYAIKFEHVSKIYKKRKMMVNQKAQLHKDSML
jgi:hypothetical protein